MHRVLAPKKNRVPEIKNSRKIRRSRAKSII
jgi:hypothetical protein